MIMADANVRRRTFETVEPIRETISTPREEHVSGVEIGLNAAIVAVIDNEPVVLAVRDSGDQNGNLEGLPFGPFSPLDHRTLEGGLRSWVTRQTGLELGYTEQLYSFGDRGRHAEQGDTAAHIVSIGYLALTHPSSSTAISGSAWRSWYQFFPWEDWRKGRPAVLASHIEPRLKEWAEKPQRSATPAHPLQRADRVRICFALDGAAWDEEKVLERFELLFEAGLVEEAQRDGRDSGPSVTSVPRLGAPMRFDHRRILATAMSRVRAKIKYRPVIFELMPPEFTLFELQKTVEAILGPHLHKQNFRRLVESAGLVEPTGEVKSQTGGRPAKLFRFRREVLLERPAPGVRVKPGRA
jgi:hypothetical protein